MDKIKEQIIDSCLSEVCKETNKKKIKENVIDPMIEHVFMKIRIYLLFVIFLIIILYVKITYIFCKIRVL